MKEKPYTYPAIKRSGGGGFVIEDRIINPKGKAYLNEDDQRAQAALMMMERLTKNKSIDALAKDHNVSTKTVERRLQQARNEGILRDARQVIIDELLGQSLATMQAALASEDLKLAATVAMKVVDGLRVFDDVDKVVEANAAHVVEDSFEVYRERIIRRIQSTDTTVSGSQPGPGTVIDALTSSPASDATEGHLVAAGGLLIRTPDIVDQAPPSARDAKIIGESDR